MRTTFALLFAALLLLSFVVWLFQPAGVKGKVVLVRVSDNNPLRQQQVDLFNRLHPKLHLELDPNGNDVSKVIVQSLGGVGPDLFDAFDAFQLSAYVRSGIAWDVTDALKAKGIDLKKECFSGILKTAIYGGRVYGVPTNIAADGIWFHRDILAQAGLQPHKGPWKWDSFIPMAEKLTIRNKDGSPLRYGFYFEWWQWADFFTVFGAHVYSPDGTTCTVDSPQAIAAVQLMYDLVYKYHVSSTPVEEASMATSGGFGTGGMSMFGAKRAAMALGGRWWLAQLRGYKGLEFGVMEMPYENAREFHAYGRATLINRASPKREQALDYLLFMAGQPYNDLVNTQADGICAFKQYACGAAFDFNPQYPNEKDNLTWRDIAERAIPDDTSPYVSGQVVTTIINDQLDLVKSNEKTPAAAMRDAAAQVDQAIQQSLADDPALARRYQAAVAAEKGGG